ncbi:MAG: 1-(5-phosphoribosyl)-5-((5-phosphoribosylamino)methylideneamino)imidazole-4-carboxamide isomerase [Acidimicrobiales bacterium mtb01]|nr:1-(5-phosphoribosyl)-5-((5-phosphoribosylamino)methylideneamino)imidazole-4-carboxamide isomerase [Actinomycetota bacterium]TEX44886.1 MAG: 1-(5-phosphoribosyl)-5-((5-phosphoribosylamino)methylideneamino)imidazole-4-carboxamide isomerase [Acidimicrobiales bacterium mtb01]
MGVELYPAIDLRGGRVVRLSQGDYARETAYGDDPVRVADDFASAGAPWVHVVDLDAARSGDPVNRPIIATIAARLAGRARLQTGGGVRTIGDAEALRAAGVSRVVMGSAAVADPPLVSAVTDVIDVAVGLDHRAGRVAVHGWTEDSGVSLDDALTWFPRASAFVITDIARDGMLSGPDVDGLAHAIARTSVPVIASGGVASLDDVSTLAGLSGLAGIITGRAIYEGRFSVSEALARLERGS